MVDLNDWRIASGQERWCRGLVFKWSQWTPRPTISYKPDGTTEPAIWDHDHCEFCGREFCDTHHDCGDGSHPLTEGWTACGPAGSTKGCHAVWRSGRFGPSARYGVSALRLQLAVRPRGC